MTRPHPALLAAAKAYTNAPFPSKRALDKMQAALQAAGFFEMRQWQPIETAPRDGTKLMLSYEGAGDEDFIIDSLEYVTEGEWVYKNETTKKLIKTKKLYLKEGGYECSYTHWMLLPPAPGKDTK